MSVSTNEATDSGAIRPFQIDIPAEAIDDLRRRIQATRLPEKETVGDATQGVQLETIQAAGPLLGHRVRLRRASRRA